MNVLESFIEKINVVGEQQIPVHVIHRAKLALRVQEDVNRATS